MKQTITEKEDMRSTYHRVTAEALHKQREKRDNLLNEKRNISKHESLPTQTIKKDPVPEIKEHGPRDEFLVRQRQARDKTVMKFRLVERPPIPIPTEKLTDLCKDFITKQKLKRTQFFNARRNISIANVAKNFDKTETSSDSTKDLLQLRAKLRKRQKMDRYNSFYQRRQIEENVKTYAKETSSGKSPREMQVLRDNIRRQKNKRECVFQARRNIRYECLESLTSSEHAPAEDTPAMPLDTSRPSKITVDSFTFHEELGSGGYGKVFSASYKKTQELVAIKVLRKTKKCESIMRERQIMEMTEESPYLTYLYAAFQTTDHMFLAMEHLSGVDLHDLIKQRGPFSEKIMRFFCAEIFCGIQHLHSIGVIHRDIKPENILLDRAGHIRICDFGVAIFGGQRISARAGTRGYAAPEIANQEFYSYAVDWFSFGVLTFQMATCEMPFNSLDWDDYSFIVQVHEPEYPEDLDPVVTDFIQQLLIVDPSERLGVNSDVASHPFLDDINWEEMAEGVATPPFHLKLHDEIDTEKSLPLSEVETEDPQRGPNSYIEEFTYIHHLWKSEM